MKTATSLFRAQRILKTFFPKAKVNQRVIVLMVTIEVPTPAAPPLEKSKSKEKLRNSNYGQRWSIRLRSKYFIDDKTQLNFSKKCKS